LPARLVEAVRKKIAKALDLRTIGYTYRQIAMRISLTRADDLVVQGMSEIIREPAQAVLDLELTRRRGRAQDCAMGDPGEGVSQYPNDKALQDPARLSAHRSGLFSAVEAVEGELRPVTALDLATACLTHPRSHCAITPKNTVERVRLRLDKPQRLPVSRQIRASGRPSRPDPRPEADCQRSALPAPKLQVE
jgi:hypothetical protein